MKNPLRSIYYTICYDISIFVFTENTELGVSMIYNVYTPALEDKIRYTYTYGIR